MATEELLKRFKIEPSKFVQGYMCAICNIINMEGIVQTPIREAYRACVGDHTIKELQEYGVDESDIETIKKYWNQLKR